MGGTNGKKLSGEGEKSGISKVLETRPLSPKEKNKVDVVLMLQSARLEEAWR